MLDRKAAAGSVGKPDTTGKRGYRRRKAPARRPTMIDVASEARVSQTTVSLVLNHADGARLSPATRQRVIKAAAKLGYQPMRRGGAPAASAATTIGFICDEFSTDPWTAIGLDGVREKAWAHGLTVTVMATRGDADMEAAALAQLAELPLAGLVYATINTRLVEDPADVAGAGCPLNCHASGGARCFDRAGRGRRRPRRDRRADPGRPQAYRLHQRRSQHGGGAAPPARLSPGARDRRPALRSRPRARGQLAGAVRLRGDAGR